MRPICSATNRRGPRRLAARLILAAAMLRPGTSAATDPDPAPDPAALRERAFATLWREDAAAAIKLFRAYLETPGAEADHEAQRGLALACSWDGRQEEAIAAYRRRLESDPSDGEARVGLGRSLLWANRLRQGRAVLREAEAGEAVTARAAGDLMLTALDEYTPPLVVTLGATWDSDDLDMARLAATGTFTVAGGRLLQIMPARTWYRQPGQPDATGLRLGAGLVTGLGHRWALHAYGWLDRLRSQGELPATAAKLDWDTAGGDAWLTWLPAARWRLDLGAGSQAVETYAALAARLERRQASLSVEHRLTGAWSASLGGIAGDYTDGNRSDRLTARLGWRREGRVLWQAGPVLNHLDFRAPYPGGYWAPDRMRSAALEASARGKGRVVAWRLTGSLGREKEDGADAITVGGVSARVGWRFSPDWLLGA
ncbi:hypothetical protein FJ250_10815, partial [bacterium]|nr:hypothetical protein [bacterium]